MKLSRLCRYGIPVLLGCSDATAPDPGTFRARLSGARTISLAGESSASAFFTVDYPDARFAMRMFDVRGSEVLAVVLHCPGEAPPAPGTYAVSPSVADCAGTYSRVLSTESGGLTVVEEAAASSGSLTIAASSPSEVSGSFAFQGALMVGTDPGGTLSASGAFSATLGPSPQHQ